MQRTSIAPSRPQRRRLLRTARKTKDADLRTRYMIVIHSAAGKSQKQIAQMLGCSVSTVKRALSRWRNLGAAGLNDRARYIVFHCADTFGDRPYYESIDLYDAFHPQTIMALLMNDRRLPMGHGAPLRLRVERQLGYKHAKFVMRIEARERIDNLYGGKGGYWEDASGYQWYAGI